MKRKLVTIAALPLMLGSLISCSSEGEKNSEPREAPVAPVVTNAPDLTPDGEPSPGKSKTPKKTPPPVDLGNKSLENYAGFTYMNATFSVPKNWTKVGESGVLVIGKKPKSKKDPEEFMAPAMEHQPDLEAYPNESLEKLLKKTVQERFSPSNLRTEKVSLAGADFGLLLFWELAGKAQGQLVALRGADLYILSYEFSGKNAMNRLEEVVEVTAATWKIK